MSFIIDTLTQNDGESDIDFNTRVQTYISDQWYYYNAAGGPWPIPPSDPGKGAYIGQPPVVPTSDTIIWNFLYNGGSGGNMRVVTFSYENTYYYKYLGTIPPLPPAPPFPTSGTLVMWGAGGTLTNTSFLVDTALTTIDWGAYQHKNALDGVDPQDLVTVNQLSAFGPGTVTSVALALPADFSITGSPVTSSGTLTGAWVDQVGNKVIASPADGSLGTPAFRALVAADIPSLSASYVPVGRTLTINGSAQDLSADRTWSVGTVTSVAISLPGEFSVSGSPVTSSGTLTGSWVNVSERMALMGPVSGGAAAPTFRLLAAGDIPDISSIYQPLDADLTAIAALGFASTSFLKKTAANTWALDTVAYAPLASPTLTGTPLAPTATFGTNTTQIATTAFVQANAPTRGVVMTGADRTTTSNAAGDITGLGLSVDINSTYILNSAIIHQCSGTGGVTFAITFPAGSTLKCVIFGTLTSVSSYSRGIISASGTLTGTFTAVAATQGFVRIGGTITTGGTAGTVQMQFASGTNTQTSTIFVDGTYLKLTKTA